MDIEAIVKKYFDPHAVYMVEGREAMRSALTELADWHEQNLSSAKLEIERLQLIIEKCGESDLIACRKINEANERIRQLEVERVPDGWEIKLNEEGSFVVTRRDESGVIIGCAVGERAEHARHIPEETLWLLASDMLAAAPQQQPKKEPRHE